MTHLTNSICILFGCCWGKLNIFSGLGCHFMTLNLLVRRDLEIIYFFVCFVVSFMFLPVYLLPEIKWPALHCVFLASRFAPRKPKDQFASPFFSISGIFYDPSICNLMVVSFLPKLTLGRVPLICETHGQFTLKQPQPCFEPPTALSYILLSV